MRAGVRRVAAAAPAAAPQLGVCQRALQPRPGAQVESLAALEDARPVCSVAWTQRGAYLAVGTNKGVVRIYDAATVRGRAPRRTPPLPGTGGVRHAGALLKLRMRGSSGAAPVPCQQTCPGPADWGAQRGGAGVQARASALAGAPGAPVLLWQGVHTRCSPRPPERLLSGAARGEYGRARRALPPSPLATGRGVAAPPGAAALLTGRRRAGRRRRWCASCARTVAAWARWPGAATRWRPAGRTGASC